MFYYCCVFPIGVLYWLEVLYSVWLSSSLHGVWSLLIFFLVLICGCSLTLILLYGWGSVSMFGSSVCTLMVSIGANLLVVRGFVFLLLGDSDFGCSSFVFSGSSRCYLGLGS